MKFKKLLVLTTFAVPTILLAASETQVWSVTGATQNNRKQIENLIESVKGVATASLDLDTGVITVVPEAGQTIDESKLQRSVAQLRGVNVTKSSAIINDKGTMSDTDETNSTPGSTGTTGSPNTKGAPSTNR